MSNLGVDEILNRLSIKFNRIVYDRDFVESVSEDLQTIIVNHNKCCVLVFPALSPNYLRLVRYQAKLCDLAVISLGSGSAKSVAVCHKKYFLASTSEEITSKDNLCSIQMADNAACATRKKRPPIQLYVPPAQRKPKLSTNVKKSVVKVESKIKSLGIANDIEIPCPSESENKQELLCIQKVKRTQSVRENICYCTDDIGMLWDLAISYQANTIIPEFDDQCDCKKLSLFKDLFPYSKLLIFHAKRVNHCLLSVRWLKRTFKVGFEDTKFENWTMLNATKKLTNKSNTRKAVVVQNVLDFRESSMLLDATSEFQNKFCWCGDRIFFYLPSFNCFYLPVPDFQDFHSKSDPEIDLQLFEDQSYLGQHTEHCIYHKNDIEITNLDCLIACNNRTESSGEPDDEKTIDKCDNTINDSCAKTNKENNQQVFKQANEVLVLDERIEPPKIGSENTEAVRCKNKYNRHEEEKQIMRKAKQNMNRKTRAILKYAEEGNDTLSISTGENVNNWEDLFNDDGELQDDFFTEIIQKVGGQEVTILKATEDYSAYASKQIEELEHMVELYDFPDTLKTHDIISNFNEIKSDSMYVKWLDDTRALLVLGSSLQAQKALRLSNALIKVRPMSAASNLALEKANQYDLKPAMKRPQTNLQTARRLITSHLGAKTKVSKEQNAKEREDLRVAKELKKQAKQNEKDAWEGNLRSSLN